jgi:hypothetical protein
MGQTRVVPVNLRRHQTPHRSWRPSESGPDLEKMVSGFASLPLDGAMTSMEGLVREMAGLLQRVGPTKAAIELFC